MIRAFLALPLPDDVTATLEAAQAGLPAGNPVPRENLHLTLVFLGEQRETVLEDLHLALEQIGGPALELTIRGVGTFGGAVPRVLYAAADPDPALSALRKKLARAVRETGIEPDGRKFAPHVTLVRFPREMPGEDLAAIQSFLGRRMGLAAGPFRVERYCLYRSTLTKNGPAYDVLAEYPLGD